MAKKQEADPQLDKMRHSAAHLMAAAVQQLWPEAKFGVGPTTKNGFFYDIHLANPLTPDDLTKIEKKMRELRNQKHAFVRTERPIDEAIQFMAESKQDFKVELLNLLKEKGSTAIAEETGDANLAEAGATTVSFYQTGKFIDLCRGPHVDNATEIGAFKLASVASAYWRGSEKNPQLQRIYGIAYPTQEALDAELTRIEESKKRDHRKLGKELEIFTFSDEVGQGLPLWLPNGTVLRKELERLATEYERADGYVPISTPVITKENLYYRSGHLPYYKDDMYAPIEIEGENYYLRPMNCPHHHTIYGAKKRSYRELPLRLAEYGQCHRYEASGALSGLMRVRSFCQNDAHIYVRYEDAKDEFLRVMRLHERYYKLFDIKDFYMRFAQPDLTKLGKYVNEPEKWLKAMDIIRQAMDESGLPYEEKSGDAAFYGPKIDFIIESVVGNEFAISTNQLDFLASDRFNLRYVGEDGAEHPLYVIHRAPLGSHERFVAFLIEHYAGNFPTWLAPLHVTIVPIADRHFDYAQQLKDQLFQAPVFTGTGGIRVEADLGPERMSKKIRNAQITKIPYVLVVGDEEMQNANVSVRSRARGDLGKMTLDTFLALLTQEITQRRDVVA